MSVPYNMSIFFFFFLSLYAFPPKGALGYEGAPNRSVSYGTYIHSCICVSAWPSERRIWYIAPPTDSLQCRPGNLSCRIASIRTCGALVDVGACCRPLSNTSVSRSCSVNWVDSMVYYGICVSKERERRASSFGLGLCADVGL